VLVESGDFVLDQFWHIGSVKLERYAVAHYFEKWRIPFCFLEFEVLGENVCVLDKEISAVVIRSRDDQIFGHRFGDSADDWGESVTIGLELSVDFSA
jgi:hypothetical protein